MKILANMLMVMGACFVALGLAVGGGQTAYAQTSANDCTASAAAGACVVAAGKTCVAPRACPGANQAGFPNCDCT